MEREPFIDTRGPGVVLGTMPAGDLGWGCSEGGSVIDQTAYRGPRTQTISAVHASQA